MTSQENIAVLVIEDSDSLRQMLTTALRTAYVVTEAADGITGLALAKKDIPDLIISDWMMPGLSGVEVCKELKLEETTSHIPVILLTARVDTSSQIQGLEAGADDYLMKPFPMEVLLVRVKNIIEQRQRLRTKFSREGLLGYQHEKMESIDDRFLMKVRDVIQQHYGDSEFSTDKFAASLGLSRTQLHRKLVALTDQSASEVLRNYRLERAADLLRQKAGSVADVVYAVGYENLSHFSKAFREKFGKLPSEV